MMVQEASDVVSLYAVIRRFGWAVGPIEDNRFLSNTS